LQQENNYKIGGKMSEQFNAASASPVAKSRSTGQVVGGVLLGVAGLLSLPDFIAQFSWLFSAPVDGLVLGYLLLRFLGTFGLIAAGILGALKNTKIVVFAGFGWFAFRLAAHLLLAVAVAIVYQGWAYFGASLVTNLLGSWDWQGWLGFIASLLGVAGAIVALVVKPKSAPFASAQVGFASQPQATATAAAPQTGTNPGWYFDPSVGAQRYWDGSAWLNIPAPAGATGSTAASVRPAGATPTLAIVAFVFSLIMPLVGLILGYVARNQARVSNNPQAGASFIKAAIIIGWIFTALGVIGSIIYGVVIGSLISQSYSY
jgi:hypothetical protein